MSHRRKVVLAALAAVLLMAGAISIAEAKSRVIETAHRGINIAAMELPPADAFDIDLTAPRPAVDNLIKAIELLYEKSPFSVTGLERLKKAGRVTILYDASFPKPTLASVTIAGFLPEFFQKQGKRKELLVVVGRFGVKWPTDKLAALIVHELVGHGIQHLRGRTEGDRKIDRECEALLYEEAANQDLDIDHTSSDMVKFRKAMERNWCADFRRYMLDRVAEKFGLWGYGKPDVPPLLDVFEDYLRHLRKTGVSGQAVAAIKAHKEAEFEKLVAAVEREHRPKDMYALAHGYLKGIGVEKDLAKARAWFQGAAEANYARAQLILGAMNENGIAGPRDRLEAYKWYLLAAAQGLKPADTRKAKLAGALSPAQVNEATNRAAGWKPTATP